VLPSRLFQKNIARTGVKNASLGGRLREMQAQQKLAEYLITVRRTHARGRRSATGLTIPPLPSAATVTLPVKGDVTVNR
jgi:hypothetical protein